MKNFKIIKDYILERIRIDSIEGYEKGYSEVIIKHKNDKIIFSLSKLEKELIDLYNYKFLTERNKPKNI